jgi:hypothetical protein
MKAAETKFGFSDNIDSIIILVALGFVKSSLIMMSYDFFVLLLLISLSVKRFLHSQPPSNTRNAHVRVSKLLDPSFILSDNTPCLPAGSSTLAVHRNPPGKINALSCLV